MPIYEPLINFIADISKSSGVRVTVERDKGVDLYFCVTSRIKELNCYLLLTQFLLKESEAGINKFIGDMLRKKSPVALLKNQRLSRKGPNHGLRSPRQRRLPKIAYYTDCLRRLWL